MLAHNPKVVKSNVGEARFGLAARNLGKPELSGPIS